MRLMIGKSKTHTTYHVIRDVKREGKRSTEIVENLGNEKSPHRCSLHWRELLARAVIECVLHTPIIIR